MNAFLFVYFFVVLFCFVILLFALPCSRSLKSEKDTHGLLIVTKLRAHALTHTQADTVVLRLCHYFRPFDCRVLRTECVESVLRER